MIEDVYPQLTPAEKAGLHNLVLYATYLESKMGYWKIQRDTWGNPVLIAVGDTQVEIATIGDLIQNYLLAKPNRRAATKLAEQLGLRTQEDLANIWRKILKEQNGNEALARKEIGKVIASMMLDSSVNPFGNRKIMSYLAAMMFLRGRVNLTKYSVNNPDYEDIGLVYDKKYRKGPKRTDPQRLKEAHQAVSRNFKSPGQIASRREVRGKGSSPKDAVRAASGARSGLRQEGIPEGLEKKIQETYGRVGIYGEYLSMENILLKVLEDVGRENNLALVEGEDFELWYRERFGIIIKIPL